MPLTVILIFLIILQQKVFAHGQNKECNETLTKSMPDHLSDKLVPQHYYLNVTVDLESNEFGGQVTILVFNNPEATTDIAIRFVKYIILHAFPKLGIVEEKTRVRRGGEDLVIKSQCRSTEKELWLIELEAPLSMGQHFLDLEFVGNMNNYHQNGLYKITYSDVGNNEEVQGANRNASGRVQRLMNQAPRSKLAMTQFYRTSARKVFPCFDEPRFKTEFSIKIRHQEGYRALCHVEAVNTEKDSEGWVVTTFHTAGIKTPTFLVGFNINPFTSSAKKEDGIVHRVWSPRKFAKTRAYALTVSPKALRFFHEFTGLPYPNIGKYDMVSIAAKDMYPIGLEDWSLVSIEEAYLLWKGEESTLEAKFEAARVIVHEASHQWFANRVSIKYLRDEWLNEGFATWIQYKGVDAVEPSWNYLDQRIIQMTLSAYNFDSKAETKAVVPKVKWFEFVDTSYGITYSKGGAILYMIESHMGKKWFKKGVQKYMKEHDGGVVVTDDLWKALQSVIDKKKKEKEKLKVASFYHTWITQLGFPVIKVSRGDNEVTLTQKRFVRAGSATSIDIWPIHVTYYKNGKKEYATFTRDTMTIRDIGKNEPIKFNVEHQGFFITWYKPWIQLTSVIGSAYLKPSDYAGLIIDIFMLTNSGKVPYADVFRLVGQILNATNSVVTWKQSSKLIFAVEKFMKTSQSTRLILANRIQTWVERWYRSDMWTEKKKSVPQIRFAVVVIELSCYFGLPRCLQDAKRCFDDWRNQNTKLTPNLRALIVRFGLKTSNDVTDLDFVWEKYEQAQDTPLAAKRTELKNALSSVGNEDLVNRYFELVLSRLFGDTLYEFFVNIANNPETVEFVWKKFSDDFEEVEDSSGLPEDQLGELIMVFAKQFSNNAPMQTIQDLLTRLFGVNAFGQIQEAEQAIDRNKRMQQMHSNAFV